MVLIPVHTLLVLILPFPSPSERTNQQLGMQHTTQGARQVARLLQRAAERAGARPLPSRDPAVELRASSLPQVYVALFGDGVRQ